jgi:tetratricopeptide (TPR) repeat protein
MGSTDKAIANMEKAVELSPGNPDLYWLLGDLYNRAQRYDDAVGAATKLLAIQPNSAGAHCVWGEALAGQGHREEARAHYQKAAASGDPAWSPYAVKELEKMERHEQGGQSGK